MSKKTKKVSTHILISLGSALALGGIVTILILQTFQKVPVIVAARDIEPYGEVITAEDFKTIEIAKGDINNFEGFVSKKEDLIGKVVTSSVYEGQPVKDIQFINPDESSGIQSIVSDKGNRGLYLQMTESNSLLGDMKIGGVYDFYIIVENPKPLQGKEDNTETAIVPLQSSYAVNKLISQEDGSIDVFMEFPADESERYIMLKNMITNNKAVLVATMPNAIHEKYDGKILGYDDFFGAVMSDTKYFTSINDTKDKDIEDTKIDTENDINKSNDKSSEE